MNLILELPEILNNPSDEARQKLLIIRGWQLQRAEAKSEEEVDFCDWMIALKDDE